MEKTKVRVLVVDDHRDTVDCFSMMLEMWGYTTATAFDGITALDIADSFDPDIVLLDLAMPEMDGLEVARRLRERGSLHPRYLVAVTGYGRPQDKIRAYEAGIECYLLKPVDEATLKAVLARYGDKNLPVKMNAVSTST